MNKIRLPRDGAEYAYFTFSPSTLPIGVVLEAQVGGAWVGIDQSGGGAKLLLRGPDAPAGSGVTVTADGPLRVRVKNAPEIIVRGAGSVVLVSLMVDYTRDPYAFSHLAGISDALTLELEQRNLPPCCFSGVVPGDAVAIDFVEDDCGGLAYVRLTAMFPSLNFPEQDAASQRVLLPAFQIEVGVFRPIAIPDNGEAADESAQFEAARLQAADMAAMLAVLCAYPDANHLRVVIGTYSPFGPSGASVGGSWLATFQAEFG